MVYRDVNKPDLTATPTNISRNVWSIIISIG